MHFFPEKCKYKSNVSTFFSLRFPNKISNGEKERLIRNIFVSKSSFVFAVAKRHFILLVGSISMACLFLNLWWDISYFLYAFLQQSCYQRDKTLVYLPYSDWSDAQNQFNRHVNAISGIHSESMKKFSSFLNEMTGKVVPVNVQVVLINEQAKKDNRILLRSIDLLKTTVRMGIPLRGHRDDFQHHPEVGKPATHAGVGNSAKLLNFVVNPVGKPLSLKQLKIIFWIVAMNLWQKVNFFSVLRQDASDSSNKEQPFFCLKHVDENGDICENFLKYIHCQSWLTDKDEIMQWDN